MKTWAVIAMSLLLLSGIAIGVGGSVAAGLTAMDRGPWRVIGGIAIGIAIGCVWALALSMLALAGLLGVAFS